MENPANQPAGTEANHPEKPAPAQMQPAVHHQSGHYQQFQPLDLPKVEPFRPSKPFSVGKLALACCNFVFALIVLGLSIGCLTVSLQEAIVLIIAGVLGLASALWQIAEFTTLLVRHSIHRPIHPGAHIGVHLVLWVLALIVVISTCAEVSYLVQYSTVNEDCTDGAYSYYDSTVVYCGFYDFKSAAQQHKYIGMFEALTAFVILMLLSHFVLFVLACVEADRRRKYGKKNRVVYLVPAPAPGDGRMYYSQAPPPRVPETAAVPGSAPINGYFAPPAPAAAAPLVASAR